MDQDMDQDEDHPMGFAPLSTRALGRSEYPADR
jgi:hypothetical protein